MIKFKKFSNGVVVCNTTPHPVTMQDVTGELVTVEPSEDFVINAKVKEEQMSPLLVKTVFEATEDGEKQAQGASRDAFRSFTGMVEFWLLWAVL